MFSKRIVGTRLFLEMPPSSRALYYQLGIEADDDGFIDPYVTMLATKTTDDDLKMLMAKGFVISFETGIVVIRHWKENNFLRSDRYKETIYTEEKSQLKSAEDGVYMLKDGYGIPMVDQRYTQDRLGKDRIGKDNKEKINKKESVEIAVVNEPTRREKILAEINAQLTDEIMQDKIADHFGISLDVVKRKKESLIDYVLGSTKNYNKYTDFISTLRNWIRRDVENIKLKQALQTSNTRGGVIDATN